MRKHCGDIKALLFAIGLIILFNPIYAQNVGINGTGAAPDTKAMLDVVSTTRGLLIPRMNQVQRDAILTPTTSLLIYQTDATPGYYYYDGGAWVRLFSGSESSDWSLSGNAGIVAGNFLGPTNSADLNLRTNNVERMSVEANGDVIMDATTLFIDASANRIGMGITTPQRQLHLHGSTTFNYLHITNSSTGSTTTDGMDVGVVSGEGRLFLRENADLAFYTNSTERVTIKNTGLLHVTITDNFVTAVTDMLNFNREASPSAPAAGIGTGITFGIEDAGGVEEQASIDVLLDDVTNLSEDATITFNVNQGGTISEIMRIDGTDGVVGIGTSTPSSTRKLQVYKNSNANKYVIHGDAHQTSLVDYQNVAVFGFAEGASASWGYATGLMGIGHQANSWKAIGVYAGLGTGPATIPSSDAALYSDAASLGYSGIFMNGNMGIGDFTPAAMLTVGSGDLFQVNSSGNLVKINNVTYSWPAAQGAAGQVLQNNGSGTLTWAADGAGVTSVTASNGLTSSGGATPDITLGGALGAATTITHGGNNMVFNLDGLGDFDIQDFGVSAFFVGDNGRVGIGDNVPFQQMEIKGGTTAWTLGGDDVGVDNLYLEDLSGADVDGGVGGSISFSGPGNGGAGARRHAAIAGVQETAETDFVGLAFYTHNDGTSFNDMQESVRISHDGKLGIGTTGPLGNLDVRGTANTKVLQTQTNTGEVFFAGGNGGAVLMGGWSAGDNGGQCGKNENPH
ncbi:MAG: hypothetical protein COA57_11050 [Flavobacteriales bacterium]|nr:MAG: hypothetical protein COA57_11050 [Flavobacteriales bacterium]